MTNPVRVDAPGPITEQEALTLMVHHLQLAIMYFEAGPENYLKSDSRVEVNRLLKDDERAIQPAWAFIKTAQAQYHDEENS